jgi:hypothetical protein
MQGKEVAMNILMMYTSMPHTTGAYLEKALRGVANVKTCGPTIADWTLRAWDLEGIADRVIPHDIELREGTIHEIKRGLEGFRPDWLLFVESGVWFEMPILSDPTLPKACYLIDTHLQAADHLQIASRFDVVFLAQKAYVDIFRERLGKPVFWLPLACDPEIHRPHDVPEVFDVAICTSPEKTDRRSRRLARLGIRYSVGVRRLFFDDMARFLSSSRLLFNSAVKDDLNMRVFESLAIGKCLLTDSVPGLADLFVPDEDLVVYEDADLVDRVRFLLDHPEVANRIGAQGRKKVLESHTYRHRALSIVRTLSDGTSVKTQGEDNAAHSYV